MRGIYVSKTVPLNPISKRDNLLNLGPLYHLTVLIFSILIKNNL